MCTKVPKMSFLKGNKIYRLYDISHSLLSLVSSISHHRHWFSLIKRYKTHLPRPSSAVIKSHLPLFSQNSGILWISNHINSGNISTIVQIITNTEDCINTIFPWNLTDQLLLISPLARRDFRVWVKSRHRLYMYVRLKYTYRIIQLQIRITSSAGINQSCLRFRASSLKGRFLIFQQNVLCHLQRTNQT